LCNGSHLVRARTTLSRWRHRVQIPLGLQAIKLHLRRDALQFRVLDGLELETARNGNRKSSPGFFRYLVDHGLPERTPVLPVATVEAAPDTAPAAQSVPWAGVVVVLVGVAALTLATLAVRRRVFAAA
jgi:hypothetical protein